jgi:hypothetical protein
MKFALVALAVGAAGAPAAGSTVVGSPQATDGDTLEIT